MVFEIHLRMVEYISAIDEKSQRGLGRVSDPSLRINRIGKLFEKMEFNGLAGLRLITQPYLWLSDINLGRNI